MICIVPFLDKGITGVTIYSALHELGAMYMYIKSQLNLPAAVKRVLHYSNFTGEGIDVLRD